MEIWTAPWPSADKASPSPKKTASTAESSASMVIKPTSIALSLAGNCHAASDQPPKRSAERDLALADIFPVAVVIELVDDAASTIGGRGVTCTRIDADVE